MQDMRGAIDKVTVAGVLVACALPSAAANILPRVQVLFGPTPATPGEIAAIVTLVMTALLMAACPFAVKRAANTGEKLVYLVIGLELATFNYTQAHDTIGKLRDLSSEPARQLQKTAAGLNSRIARVTNSRKELPQFTSTTPEMVKAAEDAVAAAETNRQQECGKVGDNCRIRVAEKTAAIEHHKTAVANRALTSRAETLDANKEAAQKELDALGVIPEHADKSASRLAKDIGKLVDLGPAPDETLIDWTIKFFAIIVEVIGLVGPRMILLSIYGDIERPARRWLWRWRDVSAKAVTVDMKHIAPLAAAAAPTRSAATPASKKKPSKIKHAAVRDFGDVREWKESRTVGRPGSKVKPGDAYTNYKEWCIEIGKDPVSLTAFGTIMKGILGVAYEEKSKRGFYLRIALVCGPKLVVSGSAGIAAGARA